jgi:hypothetical protein
MGKGGSQTTSVTIPAWLQEAAQRNLARADQTSTIGYTPYYGPDVAALTPMQEAAMSGTNMAASAFGMPAAAGSGMPPAQTFAGGVQGYSAGGLYDQALAELQRRAPGQYAALRAPFIDPITGAMPSGVYGAPAPAMAPAAPSAGAAYSGGGGGGGGNGMVRTAPRGSGTGSLGLPDPMSGGFAGTNLPGFAGNIINRVTRSLAPKPVPETIKRTTTTTTRSGGATKARAPLGGNAGRR